MIQQQSRSRVTHDFADNQLHVRLVTVDFAFTARALFILKRALVQPQKSVITELSALYAEFAVSSVMVPFAVDFHHAVDGFLFAYHAFVSWIWRLRFHVHQLKYGTADLGISVHPYKLGF
jgi:hypothetical protein